MAAPDVMPDRGPWAAHRARAEVLRDRYPFAAEVLGCYLAVLDVWQQAWDTARADPPDAGQLVAWAAEHVLPNVLRATEASGPEPLAKAVRAVIEDDAVDQALAGWLAGAELAPVEQYLARACLYAPLLALGGAAGESCVDDPSPRGGQRCPRCGGPPQVSFRRESGDRLVSGGRHLACGRCGHTWSFSSSSCAYCGETEGARRTVYAEQHDGPVVDRTEGGAEPAQAMFPHLRIDACASCQHYLIDVDLGRDNRAAPEVDELAALPLALYAADQGLTKITPNILGF